MDITIAPLARAVLVQQPGKSIFRFLSNHSIGDGMSVALLIRDVFAVLSGKTIGNLLPVSNLDELAGVSIKDINVEKPGRLEQIKNSKVPRSTVNVEFLNLSRALPKN